MRKFFLIHIFIVLFVVFIPKSLFSAGLSFGYQTSSLDVSQKFNLTLHIDTENQSLNTFSTNLLYPKDLLKVIEIKDNNSIINFWIEKKDDGNGKIYLSGITPGGFSGNKGDIVTITFEPIKSGSGKIMIDKPEVYLHDGVGTKIQIPSKLFDFSISGKYFNGEWKETVDTESPELFTPEIVSAPEIADGKKVVVFYTTDKASGIDHYVVKESKYKALLFFQNWEEVESPYILKYQSGDSTVVVKAVDKAGNTKTVSVKQPENHNFVIEIIISLGMIAVFWLIFFLFFKLIKRTVVLAEEEIELNKVKDFDDIEKLKDPKDIQEITEIIEEERTDSK
jgi:hypothetical protein